MPVHRKPWPHLPVSPEFILCMLFFAMVWLAGGASRADAFGQVVVRTASVLALILVALTGRRFEIGSRWPVAALLAAITVLVLLQLVPLPPSLWTALPGRALFLEAAVASGQTQPWRPLAIVPGETANAAGSLLVPIAALILLVALPEGDRRWLPTALVTMIALAMLVALFQLAGAGFDSPFVNDSATQVSAIFANRNHLALFLGLGCVLGPVWAFGGDKPAAWRRGGGFALVLMAALTILGVGSRAGLLIGGLGIVIGAVIVRRDLSAILRKYPRWMGFALAGAVVVIGAGLAAISIREGRALALDRVIQDDPTDDLRRRALPTVLDMAHGYFPFGSGYGGFDQLFRIHEPLFLLKPTYFNHAHNDLIEVVIGGGLAGLLLLLATLGWWGWASLKAWRAGSGRDAALAQAGSAMLLLVVIASAFDYPARTPLIMVVVVISAWWLAGAARRTRGSALPSDDLDLRR